MRARQDREAKKEGFAKSAGHQLAEEAKKVDLFDSTAIEAARSRLIEKERPKEGSPATKAAASCKGQEPKLSEPIVEEAAAATKDCS